jgi:hypothetical protein
VTRAERDFARARNEESAQELGWDPSWFGLDADDYGPSLSAAVESFQHSSLGIASGDGDLPGIVGWATFLRMHQALAGEADDDDAPVPETERHGGLLLVDGEALPVPFAVRQMPIEQDYWRCPTKTGGKRCDSKRRASPGRCKKCGKKRKHGRRFRARDGKPQRAIWHWPVTETTRTTHRVLMAKGISSNGEIGHDGTFTQFADLKYRTYHAGSRTNNAGNGFDVSLNPVRRSKIDARQRKIESWGRPPRPVIDGVSVHGWKPGPFLFYYDAQLITVAGVMAACNVYLDLSLDWPQDAGPKRFDPAAAQSFIRTAAGHFNHSDVSGKKWDACISPQTPIPSLGTSVGGLALQLAEEMT